MPVKTHQSAALERKKFFADPLMVFTILLLIVLLMLFILYPLAMLLLEYFLSPKSVIEFTKIDMMT